MRTQNAKKSQEKWQKETFTILLNHEEEYKARKKSQSLLICVFKNMYSLSLPDTVQGAYIWVQMFYYSLLEEDSLKVNVQSLSSEVIIAMKKVGLMRWLSG